MSSTRSSLLMVVPLLTVMSLSPQKLSSSKSYRLPASDIEVQESDKKSSSFPKYDARVKKLDAKSIVVPEDMDLSCFSERGEAFRKKLMEARQKFQVELTEKDAVKAQKDLNQSLVVELKELEEAFNFLQEKKSFQEYGEKIAQGTLQELKTSLESLLIDELENDFIVLSHDTKEKEKLALAEKEKAEKEKEEEKKEVVKEEKPVETSQDDKICDLQDKNLALTKQVEDLLAEQKKITESLVSMNQMMLQMQQQQQQMNQFPAWMYGPLVSPQFQYPYHSQPTVIFVGGQYQSPYGTNFNSLPNNALMGQNPYQNGLNSGDFQFNQYLAPSYQMEQQYQPMMPNPLFAPAQSFGFGPFSYNFGQAPQFQPII
jgi:hypothetical protein